MNACRLRVVRHAVLQRRLRGSPYAHALPPQLCAACLPHLCEPERVSQRQAALRIRVVDLQQDIGGQLKDSREHADLDAAACAQTDLCTHTRWRARTHMHTQGRNNVGCM